MARDTHAGLKDLSRFAESLVGHMAGEQGCETLEKSLHAVAGRNGEEVRTQKLSAAERLAIAREGGHARWAGSSYRRTLG